MSRVKPDFSTIDDDQYDLIETIIERSDNMDGPLLSRTVPMDLMDTLGRQLRNSLTSKENELAVFTLLARELPWSEVERLLASESERRREAESIEESRRMRQQKERRTTALSARIARLEPARAAKAAQIAEYEPNKNVNIAIFTLVTPSDKVLLVHSMSKPSRDKVDPTTEWGFFRVAFDSKAGGLTPVANAEATVREACAQLKVTVLNVLSAGPSFSSDNPSGTGRKFHHPFLVTVPEGTVPDLSVSPKYFGFQWHPFNCDLLSQRFPAFLLTTGGGAKVPLQVATKKVLMTLKACTDPGDIPYEIQPDQLVQRAEPVAAARAPPALMHPAVSALAPSASTHSFAPSGRGAAAEAARSTGRWR